MSHAENRKARQQLLVKTIQRMEGGRRDNIMAHFCVETGTSQLVARQYLGELIQVGAVEVLNECLFFREKAPVKAAPVDAAAEADAVLSAKPEGA